MVGLHSLLQCLQMGYAPNEPAVANRGVLAADMERAMALLLRSPTTTIADLVYNMILEFIRTYARRGNIRLFWTNTPNDWSDIIKFSLLELTGATKARDQSEHAIYVQGLKLRLILDTLAEERSSGHFDAPNSFHQCLLRHVSGSSWKDFVTRIFRLLAPPKPEEEVRREPKTPKRAKATSSKSKRGAKRSAAQAKDSNAMASDDVEAKVEGQAADDEDGNVTSTQPSTADSTPSKADHLMDEDLPEDSWTRECLPLSQTEYGIRTILLQLLETLFVFLFPTHSNYTDNIVDGFATLPSDAERLFMLNHFNSASDPHLALLDGIIMQNFEATEKQESTYTPSVPKMMNSYWNMRPIKLAEVHSSNRPRSNYTMLATLLLKTLDCLDYPNAFSPMEITQCVVYAHSLMAEVKALTTSTTVFNPDEIATAVAAAQDLVTYVVSLS